MSLTTKIIHSFNLSQKNSFAVGFVVDLPNHEYDVGADDLADPLYRLPSERVTVLINKLEQMRMRFQRWPNLSGGRQIKIVAAAI